MYEIEFQGDFFVKLLREGTWWLVSKTDPRWNCSGRGMVGCFSMPQECRDRIAARERDLGKPPEDLEWGYAKD